MSDNGLGFGIVTLWHKSTMYNKAGKVLGDKELKYRNEPTWLCRYRGDADEFVNREVL